MPKNWNPTDLEAAIAAKDKEAFDEAFSIFYREERTPMIGYARKNQKLNQAEIPDWVHESFYVCYQSCWAGKITDFGKLGGFVMGILKNQIRDHGRKHPPTASVDEASLKLAEEPEEAAADKTEALEHCLRQLSEKCQQIIRLRMAKKSMQEIAETLNFASKEVVRSTKVRCMKQLTLCLTA